MFTEAIEDKAGVFDPVAPGREKELAQLEECLDGVLPRFRAWVPSTDDLEDCRASVLERLWNEPTVLQLIHEARFAELVWWLRSCVRNELLNLRRWRRREHALLARAVVAAPPSTSTCESCEFKLQLQRALDELQPYHARLIRLAHVEGLSLEEIASRERRSPVAVKRALSRARKEIRDRWDI
jgi:RNA polymerase sigma factor (sigma-70 family)